MFSPVRSFILPCLAASLLALPGCSPRYDWREVHGATAPYTVLMPDKPSQSTRAVDLGNGMRVTMTMTGARVGDAIFAVGNAELPEPAQTAAALQSMRAAMVRNIGGTVVRETPVGSIPGADRAIEIEAAGPPAQPGAGKRELFARFVAAGRRVYQVVAIGPEQAMAREQVDTFLTSFKPD